MKKNKKKFIGVLLLIIGIVMIVVATIFIKRGPFVKTSQEKLTKLSPDILNENFELIDKREEQFCKNLDECIHLNPVFNKLKVNKVDNKEVVSFVKKVNINNEKQREIMKNSSIDIPECNALKDTYYHSISPNIVYDLYKNDNYLSITVIRENFNICTKTNESASVESIFYDIKNKKVLTVDEIKNIFQTTDAEILNSINEKLDNKINQLNNYYLYYDDNGKENVVYLYDNNFIYNYIK